MLGLIVSCQNWNTLAVEARVVSERRSKETCVKICLKNHICLLLRCFVKQKHCKQYHEVFYSTRFFCQIRNGDKSQRRPRISSQFSRFFCKFALFCLYQKTTWSLTADEVRRMVLPSSFQCSDCRSSAHHLNHLYPKSPDRHVRCAL